MGRRQALVIAAHGERFRFYYDTGSPGILHITLQHGTTPEEAIRAFVEGKTLAWDESHMRFETISGTHGILWTRHAFDQSVIVISCFKRGEEK